MLDTLGIEGLLGVVLIVLSIVLLTWHDPIVGAAVMILVAGFALVAKGIADSVMRLFGMK
ncbi:hypothetical protein AArcSl_3159 [Halalkaliarchaeum desulfuricum]|uniref:Uncharacterized protein n=1 Tax=Halalkaliarchaeum desulfuricum TaxID=2055893 RepID=A0A343TNU4_9EURY|nr:hypothetical protein [Halalkaliarchaeum desulfuricum]AUX10766.1 hypothetical protein AArcSl_3159 [Halalkaliarchaeum desulfuricum]